MMRQYNRCGCSCMNAYSLHADKGRHCMVNSLVAMCVARA
jgi:hypothetical protein